jgi:tetratricopeptide (TPR) repeat protein
MSLNNTGAILFELGRHKEALVASQEAVNIRRRLAQSRSDVLLADLAMSLSNLGIRLSNLERHEEALETSQEAVDIYRHLAQSRADATLAHLARSLGAHSGALAGLGRHREAAQAATDALRILLPFVRRHPQAHERVARAIITNIQRYSDAAGQTPDESLLEQAAQALPPEEEE